MTRFCLLLMCHHILDPCTEANSRSCLEKLCFLDLIYANCLEQCLAHSNSIEVLATVMTHGNEREEVGSVYHKHIFTSTSVNLKKTNNPIS